MARIDYSAISDAIGDVLRNHPDLDGVEVLVEENITFVGKDAITIFPRTRTAPPARQSLSAGLRTNLDIRYSIWCYGFSLNKDEARKSRDEVVGKAEIALMQDRTLGGAVKFLEINGGDFSTEQRTAGFRSGAEIEIVAQKTAIA